MEGEKDKRGGQREKKDFVPFNNLHPDVATVRADIFKASTRVYFGDDCVDENGAASMIRVDVKGEFDQESSSVEITEL